jgi:hypothetical protein
MQPTSLTATGTLGGGRFTLIRRIGEGGMGVVFEAEDKTRGERVALKTLRALGPEPLLRFKNEFRALADIRHRNLVKLGELFEEGGRWFFTMELLDGVSFLEWVRPGAVPRDAPQTLTGDTLEVKPAVAHYEELPLPALDEQRLRDALQQLARGLGALHSARKVHRDVKPTNIIVERDGRVVLLDFGLIVDDDSRDNTVVGTAAYMAPEQALGNAGPEADWYAVGALLYRALTGRLPFVGAPAEVLALKGRVEPVPPRTLDGTIAVDLDRLCRSLMRLDPKARAGSAAILGEGVPASVTREEERSGRELIGRDAELAALGDALAAAATPGRRPVLVRGPSGVGKSTLVRRFVDGVRGHALVLFGRCYERESVPYKAVDGVVDALSQHLAGLPDATVQRLSPPGLPLLARLFPVLGKVPGALADDGASLHPSELRRRAFAAFVELLRRLANERPVVVAIDDLQWADDDSMALLDELAHAPICLVATTRGGDRSLPGAVEVALAGLPPNEAAALARQLLPASQAALADDIAQAAGGHPLFIDELVRRGAQTAGLSLERALHERVAALPAESQRLVELVAVAGSPVEQLLIAAAAGQAPAAVVRIIDELRAANLVRTSGHDIVEAYHDRVREAVVAQLDETAQRRAHEALARAFEAAGGDTEALATHWREAGDQKKALHYAVLAAERAARALAFDRAAGLFRDAIANLRDAQGDNVDMRRELRIHLGEMLAYAGRGADAAEAFHLAALDGATPAEALELERRAGEQLLRSGHIDDGVAKLSTVLDNVGLSLPRSPAGAWTSLLYNRARLRLRGLKLASHRRVDQAVRIDSAHAAAVGLGIVDVVRGADFQTRSLILSLNAGDTLRSARALAMEAAHTSALGPHTHARVQTLFAHADALAKELHSPFIDALLLGTRGIAAFLLGQWRNSRALCDEASRQFRERCPGAQWELASSDLFSLWATAYLGELRGLQARVPEEVENALDRGDIYGATNLRTGSLNFVWLSKDDPKQARAEAKEAMRAWSQRGFYHQHWDDLLAQTEIELYEGDPEAAWKRVHAAWKPLKGSLLLMVQLSRIEAMHLRARAALAFAASLPSSDARRKSLLAEAETFTRKVEKEKMAWSAPQAALLRAGIAEQRGDDARPSLQTALDGFRAAEMALYAAATQRILGQLGDAEHAASATAWMTAEQVANPSRFTAMLAPGWETTSAK